MPGLESGATNDERGRLLPKFYPGANELGEMKRDKFEVAPCRLTL